MNATRTARAPAPMAALLLASLLAAVLAGCTSSATASKDVTITACAADPSGGRPTANGMIDNHSSKASTYVIKVNFYDSAGNNVSQGADTVGKVEAGATGTFHLQGLASAKGPLTCKVAGVSRTQAP
jgi:ABC-type glycerol-3-phosphate transport system substrate-binding protein